MLSRVYLGMENYNLALENASKALSLYNKLIDYNELELNNPDNPFIGYNDETIFYGNLFSTSFPFNYFSTLIKNEFYNSYLESDLRKTAYYNYDADAQTVIFKGTYAGQGFQSFLMVWLQTSCF